MHRGHFRERIYGRPTNRCLKILHTMINAYYHVAFIKRYRYGQPMPRTAIQTVLLGDHVDGWICHFGLKCSSWCRINVGTSGRSACCGIGNLSYSSVREANCMASRNFVYKFRFGSQHVSFLVAIFVSTPFNIWYYIVICPYLPYSTLPKSNNQFHIMEITLLGNL